MKVTVREDGENDPIWPNEDYTGEWIIEWPSGALKFRGYYLRGMLYGASWSYWENGQIAQQGQSFDGQSIGVWEDFLENGTKFKETTYEDSSNFVERWLNNDGSVYQTKIFKDGFQITDDSGNRQ